MYYIKKRPGKVSLHSSFGSHAKALYPHPPLTALALASVLGPLSVGAIFVLYACPPDFV